MDTKLFNTVGKFCETFSKKTDIDDLIYLISLSSLQQSLSNEISEPAIECYAICLSVNYNKELFYNCLIASMKLMSIDDLSNEINETLSKILNDVNKQTFVEEKRNMIISLWKDYQNGEMLSKMTSFIDTFFNSSNNSVGLDIEHSISTESVDESVMIPSTQVPLVVSPQFIQPMTEPVLIQPIAYEQALVSAPGVPLEQDTSSNEAELIAKAAAEEKLNNEDNQDTSSNEAELIAKAAAEEKLNNEDNQDSTSNEAEQIAKAAAEAKLNNEANQDSTSNEAEQIAKAAAEAKLNNEDNQDSTSNESVSTEIIQENVMLKKEISSLNKEIDDLKHTQPSKSSLQPNNEYSQYLINPDDNSEDKSENYSEYLINSNESSQSAEVGTEGSEVGTEGSEVGTEGSEVGTEGSEVGTEGSGSEVGTEGSEVGTEGNGSDSGEADDDEDDEDEDDEGDDTIETPDKTLFESGTKKTSKKAKRNKAKSRTNKDN